MKRLLRICSIGFALVVAGPAIAADPVRQVEQPIAYPQSDWAGFYLGFGLGLISAEFGYSNCCAGPDGWSTSPLLTAQGGYNWQRGQLVYGIEADISGHWLVADGNGIVGDFEEKALATIRGRIGGISGSTFYYATAGVGFTLLETSNPGFSSDSAWATGFTAGVGLESKHFPQILNMNDAWTGKAEIHYVNVPKTRLTSGPPTVGGSDNVLIRFGLNRYF